MPYYKYHKLEKGEIRILILSPSTATDRVNCTLERVLLTDETKFEALSYCWGSSSNRYSISCKGHTLDVTDNLFSALLHLARPHEERRLWVDAICINQSDNEEKGAQVPRMVEIYAKAWQTVVWLGADKNVVDAVQRLKRAARKSYWDTATTLKAIAPIFDAEWFMRLWVVQEVALARQVTVVAGKRSTPMDSLVDLMEALPGVWEYQDLFNEMAAGNLISIFNSRNDIEQNRQHKEPPYILELFREMEWFQMTLPKDRLYALYGLTNDIGFPVNYNKSYHHTTMFLDFAIWALQKYPSLALLSYTRGIGGKCKCAVPSWAPCYDMESLPISLLTVPHFNACGRLSTPEYEIKPKSKSKLHITGAIVDEISAVSEGCFNLADAQEQTDVLKDGARFAKSEVGQRYKTYCAALLLELTANNERAPESLIDLVQQRIEHGRTVQVWEVEYQLNSWSRFRCLCTTLGGRLVWAPRRDASSTMPGDKICIFKGARVPHVIRPRNDGAYTLVGECWVQGLMGDAAVEVPGFEFEKIVLR